MPTFTNRVEVSVIPRHSPNPELLQSLRTFFTSEKQEAYFVGGAVRDALLGRGVTDIDVAVKGNVGDVGSKMASFLGGHCVPLDVERRIARVVVHHGDSHSFIDLSFFDDLLIENLKRRDFTINAMALPFDESLGHPEPGAVIDLFNGLSDLRSGTIRAVSESVFVEDPARLLRAPRLAVQLGFEIEGATFARIRAEAGLVNRIALERIRDEFLKLLSEHGATSSLRLLDDLGLLCQVIPELSDAKGVSQPKEHYWDVFNHLVETPGQLERLFDKQLLGEDFVINYVPTFKLMNEHFLEEVSDGHTRMTILKLAALLHDISKPATKSIEPTGRIRFLGHHTEGAEVAARIATRLRLSRRGVRLIELMVQNHLRPRQMSPKGQLPSGKAIYRYFRDAGEAAIDTLYLNMADSLAARGPRLTESDWSEDCEVVSHILSNGREEKTPEKLPKLVSGYDIMNTFAMNPGPRVGELLNLVVEAHADGVLDTKEEALEFVRANLKSGVSGAQAI